MLPNQTRIESRVAASMQPGVTNSFEVPTLLHTCESHLRANIDSLLSICLSHYKVLRCQYKTVPSLLCHHGSMIWPDNVGTEQTKMDRHLFRCQELHGDT